MIKQNGLGAVDREEKNYAVAFARRLVKAEAEERAAADALLQANIDAEEAARIAADEALQANIDAEEAARIAADKVLQANIDAEEAARIAADEVLQENIDQVSQATKFYGECGTAAETKAKTVEIDDFTGTDLVYGVRVAVRFRAANTADCATLNVSETGAVQIMLGYNYVTETNTWASDETVEFVYDGAYWRAVRPRRATANYNGTVTLSNSYESTSDEDDGVAATPLAVYNLNQRSLVSRGSASGTLSSLSIGVYTIDGDADDLPEYAEEQGKLIVFDCEEVRVQVYYPMTFTTSGGEVSLGIDIADTPEHYYVRYVSSDGAEASDWVEFAVEPGAGIYYCTCSSNQAADKTAVVQGTAEFELKVGTMIAVKFDNEAGGLGKLRVQYTDKGGKTAYTDYCYIYVGAVNGFNDSKYTWNAGETVEFVYDGEYWRSPRPRHGAEEKFGVVKLSDATDSTSDADDGIAATPKAVKTAYDLANTANTAAAAAQTTADSAVTAAAAAQTTAAAAQATANGAAETAEETAAAMQAEYENILTRVSEIAAELQGVWEVLGISYYNGGLFGEAYGDTELDGGEFTETLTTEVDCGDFSDDSTTTIDGGTY